ncbi:MAG: sulfite exporter TauE/SafE family protein [Bacteroidales bacterium]|nr:sulfite exporter TauE/SafE family protein [Bacteroidales bacterium]
MSYTIALLLIISGIIAGFMNTSAGGGSVISLAVLIFLGFPVDIANATNRVAVLMQTFTSSLSFHKQKMLEVRPTLQLVLPAVSGSILGAQIAIDINLYIIERIFAVILLILILFLLGKPSSFLFGKKEIQQKPKSWWQIGIFFLIGVYGGFIQAGVGYFMLAALIAGAGFDLVRATAIKVWIVFLYSPIALLVFVINGAVQWKYGLLIGVGGMMGAWIASHLAITKGIRFIKWVIIIVILITSAQLFGLITIEKLLRNYITV